MIQQMMMLMRIEMQLRQQALFNFQQSPDSDSERAPRFDDALALNSQLSEISSILATLIRSTSVGQRSARRRSAYRDFAGAQRLRRADGSGYVRSAALRRLSNLSARQWREIDNVANDDSASTDDDDSGDDDDEVVDVSSAVPGNDVVDDFIWQQLTESDAEDHSSIDNIRSSPDGMSTNSSIPNVQSVSSIQSIPHIYSAPSSPSLSSISNINSYASSVSSSVSPESRQIGPRYVFPMNNCEHPTAEGECSCQLCTAFYNSVAVVDEQDELLLRSSHAVHPVASLASVGAHEARPRPVEVLSPLVHTQSVAAVCDPGLSEPVNAYQMYRMPGAPMSAAVNRHLLQPVLPPGRGYLSQQTSLPTVRYEYESVRQPTVDSSPLSVLPGTRRPPRLNYAARVRMQSSETARLPSEVSIRPWPLSDAGHSSIGNHLTSPRGLGNRRAGPSNRSSARQLPTHLLQRQSSAVATAPQHGSTYRGRNTRLSRHNTSLDADHTRMSRP